MTNIDCSRYKRIIDDCFWDSNISEEDIYTMLHSDNLRTEKYLFEKILINSTNILIDLKIFEKDKIKKMLKEFKIPDFNYDYIFRRKNIAEVYLFDAALLVDELKWLV